MTTWFTSDTHFSHARIIDLCNRPFKDAGHMDEMLIHNWNSVVGPSDVVYHLGDVAMGTIDVSLPKVGRLNGYKILVPGNHDRVSSVESERRRERFMPMYLDVFQEVVSEITNVSLDSRTVVLSHYPYLGDSQDKDRHVDLRPIDEGRPLLHGHIHKPRIAEGRMFHVGVDAHGFFPVHEDVVNKWLDELKA